MILSRQNFTTIRSEILLTDQEPPKAMPNLNLKHPLSDRELLSMTCKLYTKSLGVTLPVSIVGVFLFYLAFHVATLFPDLAHTMLGEGAMVAAFLLLAWIGVLWLILIERMNNRSVRYGALFLQAYQRLLSLLGALISMCFIPAIIIGLFLVAYLLLLNWAHAANLALMNTLSDPWILTLIKMGIGLLLLAVMSSKLFAPLLVFSDQSDAESALDASAALVKHHRMRTYMFQLYGLLILILAYQLPEVIKAVYPDLYPVPGYLAIALRIGLVGLLLPWTLSFWLIQCLDLKARNS